jgi:enoyl-CoA hydratase/carnithine racemase
MLTQRHDGNVTWLVLDRPERLNSFKVADYRDLGDAIETALADPATRVIVLTGNGRAFSAGADRSLLGHAGLDPAESAEDRAAAGPEFERFLRVLGECDKPLLGAVNGLAVGVGVTLLLYCDLLIAAESARFRLPFTLLGLAPEAGSSVLLAARARWDDAMWAMLSSEWLDAAAAQAMGLVWRIVPDAALVDETSRVAATIAALDPAAVTATKRLMTAGRAEAARLAAQRESAAMRRLSERGDYSGSTSTSP